ncbi:hypothetical protein TNCV_1577951 [Trichonephila clavipes]|nr:hypothetical protein TNCV_1577951 [Trichonephila clavipes]
MSYKNSNSVTQQPIRVKAYCAHPSIRDHWALRCISRYPDQVFRLKRNSQCLSPQTSLNTIDTPPTDRIERHFSNKPPRLVIDDGVPWFPWTAMAGSDVVQSGRPITQTITIIVKKDIRVVRAVYGSTGFDSVLLHNSFIIKNMVVTLPANFTDFAFMGVGEDECFFSVVLWTEVEIDNGVSMLDGLQHSNDHEGRRVRRCTEVLSTTSHSTLNNSAVAKPWKEKVAKVSLLFNFSPYSQKSNTNQFKRTATAGSDVVQSGRPIFDDFFQHLWPYIGNNTANVVFQMVKRLWLIRIDQ